MALCLLFYSYIFIEVFHFKEQLIVKLYSSMQMYNCLTDSLMIINDVLVKERESFKE